MCGRDQHQEMGGVVATRECALMTRLSQCIVLCILIITDMFQEENKCRNRLRVNIEHLEMVTHRENQRRRDNV